LIDAATDGFPDGVGQKVTTQEGSVDGRRVHGLAAGVRRKAEPAEGADFVRRTLERLPHAIVELEVERKIGAARYERTETRTKSRNGSRPRDGHTTAGTVQLRTPRLRPGACLPVLLARRGRADRALTHLVAEACVAGVSTRRVEQLDQALGLDETDKSAVFRLATVPGEEAAFRSRPLPVACPYLRLEATFPKVRQDGPAVSMAPMTAIGVMEDGVATIVGLELGSPEIRVPTTTSRGSGGGWTLAPAVAGHFMPRGAGGRAGMGDPSEDGSHWRAFLRSLRDRGQYRIILATSVNHPGLLFAVSSESVGATWRRYTVHCTRRAVAQEPKHAQPPVSRILRLILSPPDCEATREQLQRAVIALQPRLPRGGRAAGAGEGRRPGAQSLPTSQLAADPFDQRPGAPKSGDRAATQYGGHVPAPRCRDALGRRAADRTGGRVGNAAASFRAESMAALQHSTPAPTAATLAPPPGAGVPLMSSVTNSPYRRTLQEARRLLHHPEGRDPGGGHRV
jgi:putative transposase